MDLLRLDLADDCLTCLGGNEREFPVSEVRRHTALGNAGARKGFLLVMPLPTDSADSINPVIGSEMVDVSRRRVQAGVSQLMLNISYLDAFLGKVESTRVTQAMDVDTVTNTCTIRRPLEHPTDIGIVEAIALMRAELIRAGRPDLVPGADVRVENFRRDGDYPSLSALASTHRNRAAVPVDISWAEIQAFVAADLGVQVDCDQGAISDSRLA